MQIAGGILVGSTLLTGAAYTLIQGRGTVLLLALTILVTMGCLVALIGGMGPTRGR